MFTNVCLHVYVILVSLISTEVRRGWQILWNWSSRTAVSHHVGTENESRVLSKKSKCFWLLSHHLSPNLHFKIIHFDNFIRNYFWNYAYSSKLKKDEFNKLLVKLHYVVFSCWKVSSWLTIDMNTWWEIKSSWIYWLQGDTLEVCESVYEKTQIQLLNKKQCLKHHGSRHLCWVPLLYSGSLVHSLWFFWCPWFSSQSWDLGKELGFCIVTSSCHSLLFSSVFQLLDHMPSSGFGLENYGVYNLEKFGDFPIPQA